MSLCSAYVASADCRARAWHGHTEVKGWFVMNAKHKDVANFEGGRVMSSVPASTIWGSFRTKTKIEPSSSQTPSLLVPRSKYNRTEGVERCCHGEIIQAEEAATTVKAHHYIYK